RNRRRGSAAHPPASWVPLSPPLRTRKRGMWHPASWRRAARRWPSGALLSSDCRGQYGMSDAPILRVEMLPRHFPVHNAFGWRTGLVRALDGVSFEVRAGETLGIVGESGCGKSTLGKALVGIHPPARGRIHFEGRDITRQTARERRGVAPKLQYCYQDPGNSLDPRWTVRRSLAEPLTVHTALPASDRAARIHEIMSQVGLPHTHLDLFPHELSGGQQRRVGLARILTLHPRLVVLDEPTSGLDVSVQSSVL